MEHHAPSRFPERLKALPDDKRFTSHGIRDKITKFSLLFGDTGT